MAKVLLPFGWGRWHWRKVNGQWKKLFIRADNPSLTNYIDLPINLSLARWINTHTAKIERWADRWLWWTYADWKNRIVAEGVDDHKFLSPEQVETLRQKLHIPELKHDKIERYLTQVLQVADPNNADADRKQLKLLFDVPRVADYVDEAICLCSTPEQVRKCFSLIMGDNFAKLKAGEQISPYVFGHLICQMAAEEISFTQAKVIVNHIYAIGSYWPSPPKPIHPIPRGYKEMCNLFADLGVQEPWDFVNVSLEPWDRRLGPPDDDIWHGPNPNQWCILMVELDRLQTELDPQYPTCASMDTVEQIQAAKEALGIVALEEDVVDAAILKVLETETDAVAKVLSGNQKPFQRLVGETMKLVKGNAPPEEVRAKLQQQLAIMASQVEEDEDEQVDPDSA